MINDDTNASTNQKWTLYKDGSNDKITMAIHNGTVQSLAAWGSASADNTNYLVVFGYDLANIQLSVNGGTYVATANTTGMRTGNLDQLAVAYTDGGLAAPIDVGAIYLFSSLPSQDQVTSLYNSGAGRRLVGVGY